MPISSGSTPLALPGGLNAGKTPAPPSEPLVESTPAGIKLAHDAPSKTHAFKPKKKKAFK